MTSYREPTTTYSSFLRESRSPTSTTFWPASSAPWGTAGRRCTSCCLSSVINIFLDLFTILVMGMGVEGAAYATVISQAISGVLCFLYMRSHFPILRMTREERKFNLRMAKILCGIGIPMGLQYSITAIGSVILQTAVNGLGSLYVAAISAGNKLTLFFTCPFEALGATMATWAGQNVGAGKIDRVKEGVNMPCSSAASTPSPPSSF